MVPEQVGEGVSRMAGMRAAAAALLVAILAGCDRPETPPHLRIAGADAERGHEAIPRYGCGACHRVPGIPGAKGLVGPPLDHFGERAPLAGQLPNRPATLTLCLVRPRPAERRAGNECEVTVTCPWWP